MLTRHAKEVAPRAAHASAGRDTRDIDQALVSAVRRVRLLAAVTPENVAEQRHASARDLGRGAVPSPRFRYGHADRSEVLRDLEGIARTARTRLPEGLTELYLARIDELTLEARIAEAAGTARLGELARARYEGPAAATSLASDVAAEWLRIPTESAGARTRSDSDEPGSLLNLMRAAVGARRLPFAVQVSSSLLSRAATGERTIWVSRAKLLTAEEAHRTVIHEVLGHAMPRVRAASRCPIFSIGTARGGDHQEGLALLTEERAGALGPMRKRELAARHWAVERMRAGAPFGDVARALVREHGVAPDGALEVTERAFRGSDGTGPGLGRERVYIDAWLRVRAHVGRRPEDESILAAGQVGLEWLDVLSTI